MIYRELQRRRPDPAHQRGHAGEVQVVQLPPRVVRQITLERGNVRFGRQADTNVLGTSPTKNTGYPAVV